MKSPLELMDDIPPFEGFPKEGLTFLRQLKRNNNRGWFEKNKQRYEETVKIPMQSLIVSLREPFRRFAPEYDLHPKRSIFRIYRDTRFSPDKTPYKTHVAAHVVLGGQAKGFVGSGYYFHIDPSECYVGAGIYMPDNEQLKAIRSLVAGESGEFLSIIRAPKFVRRFKRIEGQRLVRMPKEYDDAHPMADWIKLKQYFVGVSGAPARSGSRSFVDFVAAVCEDATPLVRFLNEALAGGRRV